MFNYLLNKKCLIIVVDSVGYSVDVREYVPTKETGTKSKKNINLLEMIISKMIQKSTLYTLQSS